MTEEIIIDGVNVAGCNNKGIKALGQEGTKYCILENDGISLCVCKHRPCGQLKRLEQERNDLQDRQLTLADTYQEARNICKRLEQENEELKTWLESKEKQLKHLIEYNQKKKDQIKTLRFMLFDEKEIPKDKFTMMYRIAQNERRTKSHQDLCTNVVKKLRSALEEINKIAEPRFVNGLNEEADLCNLAMDRIQNKIKEVLNSET